MRIFAEGVERTISIAACSCWPTTSFIRRLPEKAFKVVQQQTAESVAGQLQSPDYLTARALTTRAVSEKRSVAAGSDAGDGRNRSRCKT